MSRYRRRLDTPYWSLTPSARVGAVLRCWRIGIKPDSALSYTPSADRATFEALIELVLAVTQETAWILLLRASVSALDAQFELLETRRFLGRGIRVVGAYIRISTTEPATLSDFQRRESDLRNELVPVRELAEMAAESYADWVETDYTLEEGERVLTKSARVRARAESERELVSLFRSGALTGEEAATGIRIEAGAFYDLIGEDIPVLSESGDEYEIFPDAQTNFVASMQNLRRSVEALIVRAPGRDDLPLELQSALRRGATEETTPELEERLEVAALRDRIAECWNELRCYEIVIAELARKFDGEDPLHVDVREVLCEIRRGLIAPTEEVRRYGGTVALSEPRAADVAVRRKIIQKRANQWSASSVSLES